MYAERLKLLAGTAGSGSAGRSTSRERNVSTVFRVSAHGTVGLCGHGWRGPVEPGRSVEIGAGLTGTSAASMTAQISLVGGI
jgi:hypothetical protein